MAGTLQIHPYSKTYDEAQRSIKRMNAYLVMNESLLPTKEIEAIKNIIEYLEEIILNIPEQYHLTMHQQYSKKN